MSERRKREKTRKTVRLTAFYYRLRRRLGLPEIDPERLRRQKRLVPERDAAGKLEEEDERRLRLGLLCLAGAGLLALLAASQNSMRSSLTLVRPGYGEEAEETSVDLEYEGEMWEISLEIPGLQYTEEEWETYRQEAWEAARQRALGENTGWDAVTTDLDFSEETGIPGITVEWSSADPERIAFDGTVTELAESEEAQEVTLTAVFRCGEWEWTKQQTATVIPAVLSREEKIRRELTAFLQKEVEEENGTSVELPASFGETELRYRTEEGVAPWMILVLGILAAAALWLLPEQRRREAEQKREKELALSYPELVEYLTVLLGAGLTVRGAWERMTAEYRASRERDGRRRILYEEMLLTWNSFGQGVYEEAAYVAFGRRCGLRPYLRLGSLLETNLKKGNKGLLPMLREEAEQAMEERLQLARKLGEEASTKLLFPMMLLFALVLIILIVPAFWSF
ncbi:MAG: hypothetical protein LUC27_02700 [Lachnospiraceae bacterium]|nr:hypothetical protein [Lachnospiraceae bacterium]